MTLANNANWVSSPLFRYGTAKLRLLGRRLLKHVMRVTELLLL